MRTLAAGLQDHLDSGATTLCWCWRITRNDAVAFGFTDHDRDLAFDGTTFEAASGFTGSEISGAVGLNVDTLDVDGALKSDRLNEADLAAGLFDNALIEIYRVNWADPAMRVLMRYGNLGEVSRGAHHFRCEVRGLAHELQQPKGRMIQYGCDADLGGRALRGEREPGGLCGQRRRGEPRGLTPALHGLGAWRLRHELVHAGAADLGLRRERRHDERSEASRQGLERGDHRAVAEAVRSHRARRRLPRHGRLRQTVCDVPRQIRQHGEFPRLPPRVRQRLHAPRREPVGPE